MDKHHFSSEENAEACGITHIVTFANVVGQMLCIHPCLSVCLFVCLSVCLSVSRITQKVMDGFERNIMRW